MDRTLNVRVDQDFMDKLSYLRRINQYKSISETIRRIVEKEYEKEQIPSILTMTKDEQKRIKAYRPFGLSEDDMRLAEMYREQREAVLKQCEENRKKTKRERASEDIFSKKDVDAFFRCYGFDPESDYDPADERFEEALDSFTFALYEVDPDFDSEVGSVNEEDT